MGGEVNLKTNTKRKPKRKPIVVENTQHSGFENGAFLWSDGVCFYVCLGVSSLALIDHKNMRSLSAQPLWGELFSSK